MSGSRWQNFYRSPQSGRRGILQKIAKSAKRESKRAAFGGEACIVLWYSACHDAACGFSFRVVPLVARCTSRARIGQFLLPFGAGQEEGPGRVQWQGVCRGFQDVRPPRPSPCPSLRGRGIWFASLKVRTRLLLCVSRSNGRGALTRCSQLCAAPCCSRRCLSFAPFAIFCSNGLFAIFCSNSGCAGGGYSIGDLHDDC